MRSRPITAVLTLPAGLLLFACAAHQPVKPANGDELMKIAGGTIEIAMDSELPFPRLMVDEWVHRAAVAVSGYLGRFPTKHLLLTIETRGRQPIGGGVTYGDTKITVRLGRRVTKADLDNDWVLTHEMFHLAFPTLNERYLWMMEGLSDYLEPLARARAGQLAAAAVWREWVENFPDGLPAPGDGGLDDTPSRNRIYWGGNIYWLLADVRIRVATNNHRGVDDAIRAILAAGGSGGHDWTLEYVLAVGDKATGTSVLKDLYDEFGNRAGHIDLDALWKQLGVVHGNGIITFDDSAPRAKIRAAITAPASNVTR